MGMAFVKADREKLGVRLQDARISARLTQEEVAESCGVTAKHISCVERGKIGPSLALFSYMVRAYQVPADDLLRDLPREIPRGGHQKRPTTAG